MTDNSIHRWLGQVAETHDVISPTPVKLLAATLDRDTAPANAGDALPPLWHWLYFLPSDRQSSIGADGHAKRGGFLPPVPLPRRMWAGGRLKFLRPLVVGSAVQRVSRIADISSKQGRTGELVFVRVLHEIFDGEGVAITEEHDIVYRDMPQPGEAPVAPKAAPTDEQFGRRITPDPVLLFRYSALTFNGHRIHYDRSYVTQEEGYPGLVVHGPLIATLLIEELQRAHSARRIATFDFKAVSPLFDIAPFEVCGRLEGDVATLWARGPAGQLAMQATATLAQD
ncbi:FAS1-like dehydratase domain-containing protein [Azohydromonas lata]|uniref:MaoC family dehydratase N-terminal domain-containing protein n=1 Tax=Azohydromonas lata TaxID=45677 RepID=A0ABU5IH24_9BURK|nr:MaoC family dehydratase N-terminal domain-containing protein [Azohydromonas lata]MDZ5457935.1 MaoC family dehydratase N-terminal domain-containing protein [Azohydromonas lata]